MSRQNHIEFRKLIREELRRINESRLQTFSSEILYNIGKNIPDLKRVSSNTMVDGAQGLYRYKDGNAYEVQIRPVEYANDKENWKKFTSKKVKMASGTKVTSEEVKQALWLAFKETADQIEYVGDDADFHIYKIVYNNTLDTQNIEGNLKILEDAGIGTFTLDRLADGFLTIKHKKGTGDKYAFDELVNTQNG